MGEIFIGGKNGWVKSLTAIASPHNGSPLIDILGTDVVDFLRNLVLAFAALVGDTFFSNVYDFMLDHWGLSKIPDESFLDYLDRVLASPVFSSDNEDVATFDVSPAGAAKLQALSSSPTLTYPGTYYFSYATGYTNSNYLDCWINQGCSSVGKPLMWLPLQPTALLLGSRRQQSDESLRENDGVVPLESSKCPNMVQGNSNHCKEHTGGADWAWTPGVWHWEKAELDHIMVTGWTGVVPATSRKVTDLYKNHAQQTLQIHSP